MKKLIIGLSASMMSIFISQSVLANSFEMPLYYKVDDPAYIYSNVYIRIFEYSSAAVDKYCKVINPKAAKQELIINAHYNNSQGKFDTLRDITSDAFCVEVGTPSGHTFYGNGPFVANETCNVDYGSDSYPDVAAFDVRNLNLIMRAKIDGYKDNQGNIFGNIDDCFPKATWAGSPQRVSVKPASDGSNKAYTPIIQVFDANKKEIYYNKLKAMENLCRDNFLNCDTHFTIYADNTFYVKISGGGAKGTIYRGPYSVAKGQTCELHPQVDENGNLFMHELYETAGCYSGASEPLPEDWSWINVYNKAEVDTTVEILEQGSSSDCSKGSYRGSTLHKLTLNSGSADTLPLHNNRSVCLKIDRSGEPAERRLLEWGTGVTGCNLDIAKGAVSSDNCKLY